MKRIGLRVRLAAAALCILFDMAAGAVAATTDDAAIPAVLRDWRGWVLKDQEFRVCPFLATQAPGAVSAHVCAWPGRLALDANADGVKFAVHWRIDAPSWIALPGDAEHWPQNVTVSGQHQAVLARDGVPMLWLAAGSYDLAGTIPWHERPQSLRVPPGIALVALTVDGKPVAPVQRDADQVTLGRSAAATPEADNLELHVFRKLSDGVPAELETRIQFAVSGQAREETIGPVLPDGFAATALDANDDQAGWPARLDNDGRLHVQVQPGAATLVVRARALAPLTAITARVPQAPWPQQEIFSYQADAGLRVTSANAALAVDPKQAQVPDEWAALPAFALGDGATLSIEERSRGLAANEANRLTLRREAWLDFDGSGWHARDVVAGTMVQGWRLDVAAPYTLERAKAQAEPLLVTRGATNELSGVEWRTPQVALSGSVHIDAASSMPAGGWQQSFDKIDATLHFPYGYKLLGAPGADDAYGSWMSRWTLLDVFIAAILLLLSWRLLGAFGALAAFGYLVLGYQESDSPLWTLLAALAFGLIARALPAGKLKRASEWLRRGALLLLVLCALPFLIDQVRYALYPQLEPSGSSRTGFFRGLVEGYSAAKPVETARDDAAGSADEAATAVMPSPVAPPPPPSADMATPEAPQAAEAVKSLRGNALQMRREKGLVASSVSGNRVPKSQAIDHYSQSTVVQTGAGEPHWDLGSTAQLSWSGPVLPTQNLRLLIAPPWLVRPLRLLLAALLVWLAWRCWRPAPPAPRAGRRSTVAAAGVLLAAGLVAASSAQAQGYPSDALLQQLRERLTEAPKCAPACASVAEVQISASGDAIGVVLEVHAAERVAFPLPASDATAMLKSIKVDNVADAPVARRDDGSAWLALDRGVHRVELDYAAFADKLALNFALVPARARFAGSGWSASGIEDDRLLTTSLTLARTRDAGAGKPALGAQQFPPYVRIERALMLGLDWSIQTTAQRLSPSTGGFSLSVPLAPGEHVSTPGIKVQNADGQSAAATVAIADGSAATSWSGTLDKADTLTLTAPPLADRAEVWRVVVSPTWHVEFAGVPGVGLGADTDPSDYRNFEFHPLPGETLTLKVTRPAPIAGATRAIDAVSVASAAGQRSATQTLTFTLRASQGGEQAVTLPQGAEVIAVKRDTEVLNLRAQDGRLSLPVRPGAQHFEVTFRDNSELGFVAHTPALALGLPAANIDLDLQLPTDRWVLAVWGPPVGPAVLYWGELIVVIGMAFALARTRRTRLKFHDWLLLGLGFSTFSWLALLIVVAWLLALDWRARTPPLVQAHRFNALQILLALLTVAALIGLVSAIPQGLLGQPDMHVVGNGSQAHALRWFADRSSDALPQASAVSLPLWVYKVLMLAWALWLANALIGWLRDGLAAWTQGGYWRSEPRKAVAAQAAPPPDPGA